MHTKKAFSLIEIIIFIAVLSILMTTLLQSVALNLSADNHQSQE
ncbi:type II secretion system protein, partial [Helicobacter pullorum]